MELVLLSVVLHIRGKECLHWTDNQAASIIMQIRRKPELQEIVVRIFEFCYKNCIKLTTAWFPREQNERADFYSKLVDHDDWMLAPEISHELALELPGISYYLELPGGVI